MPSTVLNILPVTLHWALLPASCENTHKLISVLWVCPLLVLVSVKTCAVLAYTQGTCNRHTHLSSWIRVPWVWFHFLSTSFPLCSPPIVHTRVPSPVLSAVCSHPCALPCALRRLFTPESLPLCSPPFVHTRVAFLGVATSSASSRFSLRVFDNWFWSCAVWCTRTQSSCVRVVHVISGESFHFSLHNNLFIPNDLFHPKAPCVVFIQLPWFFHWVRICMMCLKFSFNFLWPHLQYMKVSRPGIESKLYQARDWTCASAAVRFLTHCTTVGTPIWGMFLNPFTLNLLGPESFKIIFYK